MSDSAAEPTDTLYNWHVWVSILLSASICAMVNLHPYISPADQVVELFALVALICIGQVGRGGSHTPRRVNTTMKVFH